MINLLKTDPPKASQIPETVTTTSVVETKPLFEVAVSKSEIKPTKPVAKPTKQLSSVVRVVSANSVAPSSSSAPPLSSLVNDNNAPKPAASKVQIVSSHVESIDESKKSAHKPVVHVEAVDSSAILPSRVEVVGGISPPESYVENPIIIIGWYYNLADMQTILFKMDFFHVVHDVYHLPTTHHSNLL